jgi:hypothetical protein
MSEKETLMRSLFDSKERELVNIKFFQSASGAPISEEEFCSKVNEVVFSIRTGLTAPLIRIDEDDLVKVNINELVKKLAPCG